MSEEEAASTSATTTESSQKRTDYLVWDDFYMAMCLNATTRCPSGSNPNAVALASKDKQLVCLVHDENGEKHTEIRALEAAVSSKKGRHEAFYMYTTRVPCEDCAWAIVASKLVEVVYVQDRAGQWPLRILEEGSVRVRKFQAQTKSVKIDLGKFSDEQE